MDQQAQAIAQVAQATHSNSKALEKLADASHVQVTLIINSTIRVALFLLARSDINAFLIFSPFISGMYGRHYPHERLYNNGLNQHSRVHLFTTF